ncbi:MAG TPA: phosphoribosylamine--glycine ligase [Candidatus Xenobia bacterium]|jgi:phosphoribosylamine--glycine ligase
MKVLVIGNGAREHALAWALGREATVTCSPGNAGTPVNVELSIEEIAPYARLKGIGLVVVGPEAPLAAGLADRLTAAGIKVFGPCQDAAQLEASKAWAKDFMVRYGVPTARSETVTSVSEAEAVFNRWEGPVVVKASGLAGGKGVTLHDTVAGAREAVKLLMEERVLGEAGDLVLLEERLDGLEISLLTLVSDQDFLPLPVACDYKRRNDGDEGPNTGGMGAYCPAISPPDLLADVERQVIRPVLQGLRAEGITYRGVLYIGLMLTSQGPKVLEFNVRFGDPETQVIVPLLDGSWLEVLQAVAEGRLGEVHPRWRAEAACGVVVAAPSYPTSGTGGIPVPLAAPDDLLVFHAGTRQDNGQVVSNGGRVLTVVACRPTRAAARDAVYGWLDQAGFDGFHYRRDIAAAERLARS